MEILTLSSEYIQNGLSIFPLRPRDKKPLLRSWEPYQKIHASKDLTEKWFSNGHAANNIAIVTGKISRIIAFDIDGEEGSACFNRAVESHQIDMGTTDEDLSPSITCSHCFFNRSILAVCKDRICLTCGNDHSFKNNFAGVIKSIDLILELLYRRKVVLQLGWLYQQPTKMKNTTNQSGQSSKKGAVVNRH